MDCWAQAPIFIFSTNQTPVAKKNHYSLKSCVAKFFTRVICVGHLHRKPYICRKHLITIYNCKMCKLKSIWMPYTYLCTLCNYNFCLFHFIEHAIIFGNRLFTHAIKRVTCQSSLIKIDNNYEYVLASVEITKIAAHLQNISIKFHKREPITTTRFAHFTSIFLKANKMWKLGT